ncbi:hypothetical protein V5O48_001342 [Marasmius crinis-equi]|uniref:Large ribosomal subunit protein mL40 n=1 Tax=Marasmius crinis-equi TaxID=585013 RepID=A0ABR3FZB6_9AGAR
MSASLFSSKLPQKTVLRIQNTSVRCYARKVEGGMDPRRAIMHRALYPGNIRNRPTPTGTWRPKLGEMVQRAIPSVQAHETIERAWLLHRRHVRKRREEELERKFNCMKEAMDELSKIDSHLYYEANKPSDPRVRTQEDQQAMKSMKAPEARAYDARIRGLFPREMRIPTDTPSRNGWNYDFNPVKRPI